MNVVADARLRRTTPSGAASAAFARMADRLEGACRNRQAQRKRGAPSAPACAADDPVWASLPPLAGSAPISFPVPRATITHCLLPCFLRQGRGSRIEKGAPTEVRGPSAPRRVAYSFCFHATSEIDACMGLARAPVHALSAQVGVISVSLAQRSEQRMTETMRTYVTDYPNVHNRLSACQEKCH
jgi:hypothetical protein